MKESINRLIKNYSGARKSWETWCYLNNIDMKINSDNIRETYIDKELLSHFRYLALKDIHLELYKILRESKSSRDNIFKLLKNDNQDHTGLITEFSKLDSVINDITDVRDKFYAHLDHNYKEYLKSFKINDFNKIFTLIEKSIINLGFETELLETLKTIPSRNEFTLTT